MTEKHTSTKGAGGEADQQDRFLKVPRDLLSRQDLGAGEKLLLAQIADQLSRGRGQYLGVRTLADDLGMGTRNAVRILARLEGVGVLEIDRPGNGRRNIYTVKTVAKMSPVAKRHRCQNVTKTVAKMSPEALPKCQHTKTRHTKTKRARSKPPGPPPGFDRFWAAYPRKVAKAQAAKAWAKLKPDDELVVTIIGAVERQAQSDQWQRDGGKFIPYPATWLNGRRWEDEASNPQESDWPEGADPKKTPEELRQLAHELYPSCREYFPEATA